MTETKRGGPGRGQGRKRVADDQDTIIVSLRMTERQREKMRRLGGAVWVRECIDRASEPEEKK